MSQTSVIFAYILVAWLIFITARGELPKYLAVIFGGTAPAVG